MRLIIRILFLWLLIWGFPINAHAQQANNQTCNGSLGDPVIDENFGAGSNPGAALAPGVTNMQYTSDNDPEDGSYTIANSLTAAANTHPYTWWSVPNDHTGNPNGYMMIVNASQQPSIFFTQAANGLCPNTTYEFSAYILNLMIPGPITINYTHPNITFSIETTQGLAFATKNTGIIPASSNGYKWVQYTCYFTTPANVTDVVVVMSNNAPGGNGNDFILDDITFRACGPIIEEGFSSASGSKSQSLCQGSSANFTLAAQVIGNGTPAYQWQSNTNGNWADIPGENSAAYIARFTNAAPGVYPYRLGVANGSAITDVGCRVYSAPLTIYVNPLPVVPPIGSQAICEGSQLQLTASGGASYTWSGPNLAPTSQNPLIINNVTGTNTGTYTVVALSDSGCTSAPVHTQVTVVPKILPGINNNVAVCAGESTQLSASGGLYYTWTPSTGLDQDNIANPTATPLQTTTYTAHISNGACSDSSKSVTVTVNQNPVADAGDEIILFEGQSAKLNGTVKGDNITSYSWSPATFLTNQSSLTPTTTPTDDITYTLTAVSSTCGTSTSSVFVRVYKKITIPNTFSPNNDGVNDVWNIDALVTYPASLVHVFDRYGQAVFQSTGYAKPWDGTLNGKPLAEGTYYYVIDLKNGTPKMTGWLLLVK